MAGDRRSYPFFGIIVTSAISKGSGDVIAVDDSQKGTAYRGDVYNVDTGNDVQILGICTTAYFNVSGAPLAAREQGIITAGSAHVRLADDNSAIQAGDLMMAEADSQITNDANNDALAATDVGASDLAAFTNINTGDDPPEAAQISLAFAELGKCLGTAMEDAAASTDDDNDRIEIMLRLHDVFTIANA